jgi:hypothetical protein
MLIVDNIGVAVVASIAKATVEAPSTADLAGTFGGTVNPAPVDGRFWDKALTLRSSAKQRLQTFAACVSKP